MKIKAYAKINLSLDILGCREDGYHNISSLMQNIGLYDIVEIEKCSKSGTKCNAFYCSICGRGVYLCTNVKTIPMDANNLAVKGARVVLEALAAKREDDPLTGEEFSIYIEKKLPVAAGIAGGSGNAAAVMLGINSLEGYPFSLRELMQLGVKAGADIPFSLMMNAYMNKDIFSDMPGIQEASCSAMIGGIGDVVEPVSSVHRHVIMANPGIAVSTKAAYEAIDALADSLSESGLFTNQLEKYTLANYPEAMELRTRMKEQLRAELVLMSGSGPTMVAYYTDKGTAEEDFAKLQAADWMRPEWRAWLTETGEEQ